MLAMRAVFGFLEVIQERAIVTALAEIGPVQAAMVGTVDVADAADDGVGRFIVRSFDRVSEVRGVVRSIARGTTMAVRLARGETMNRGQGKRIRDIGIVGCGRLRTHLAKTAKAGINKQERWVDDRLVLLCHIDVTIARGRQLLDGTSLFRPIRSQRSQGWNGRESRLLAAVDARLAWSHPRYRDRRHRGMRLRRANGLSCS